MFGKYVKPICIYILIALSYIALLKLLLNTAEWYFTLDIYELKFLNIEYPLNHIFVLYIFNSKKIGIMYNKILDDFEAFESIRYNI